MKKMFIVMWSVVLAVVAIYIAFIGVNKFKLWRADKEFQKIRHFLLLSKLRIVMESKMEHVANNLT